MGVSPKLVQGKNLAKKRGKRRWGNKRRRGAIHDLGGVCDEPEADLSARALFNDVGIFRRGGGGGAGRVRDQGLGFRDKG